jgi:hypothetical protein
MLRQATAPQTENLPYNPGADLPISQWKLTPEQATEVWGNFEAPVWKKPGGIETLITLKNRKTRKTAQYSICSDAPLNTRQLESAALLLTGERLSKFSLVSLTSQTFEF